MADLEGPELDVVPDVFISYPRTEINLVRPLEKRLREVDLEAWVDYGSIPPSYDWLDEVRDGILRARAFLCVITDRYMQSEICRFELDLAIETGKRIICVVVEEPTGDTPQELARINWIFCPTEDDLPTATDAIREAVASDPAWSALHTTLLVRAAEWKERGRPRSALIRGVELREASGEVPKQRDPSQPQPTQIQRDYVEASERAAQRRRTAYGLFGAALLVAALVGSFVVASSLQRAEESQQQAQFQEETSQSRSLAAQAVETLERDVRLGSLLAVAAYRKQPTPDALAALLQAAMASEDVEALLGDVGGLATTATATSGGELVVAAGAGGVVNGWSSDGAVVEIADAPISIFDLDFGPDGAVLAGALSNGDIALWDVSEAEIGPPTIISGHSFEATAVDISRMGMLASTGVDGRLLVWGDDGATELYTRADGALTSVRWRPDGGALAVAHRDGIAVISLQDPPAVTTISVTPNDTARSLAWINETDLVVAVDKHLVRVASLGSSSPVVWESTDLHDQNISAVGVTPNGDVVAAGRDGVITVTASATGVTAEPPRRKHGTRVLALAVYDGGFISADADGAVIRWSGGAASRIVQPRSELIANTYDITSSEHATAIATNEGELIVYHDSLGRMELEASLESVATISVDTAGTMLAAIDDAGELVVLPLDGRVVEPSSFQVGPDVELLELIGPEYLAWGDSQGEIAIISLIDGEEVVTSTRAVEPPLSGLVGESSSGRLFVSGASSTIAVFDIADSDLERVPTTHTDWIDAVAVDRVHGLVATGDGPGDGIIVRNLDGGNAVSLRGAHDSRIEALDFNDAGTKLVSGDSTGHVALWSLAEGEWRLVHVFEIEGAETGIGAVGFQSDGGVLVTTFGSEPYDLVVDANAVIGIVCAVMRSDLTDEERTRFGLESESVACPGEGMN